MPCDSSKPPIYGQYGYSWYSYQWMHKMPIWGEKSLQFVATCDSRPHFPQFVGEALPVLACGDAPVQGTLLHNYQHPCI